MHKNGFTTVANLPLPLVVVLFATSTAMVGAVRVHFFTY